MVEAQVSINILMEHLNSLLERELGLDFAVQVDIKRLSNILSIIQGGVGDAYTKQLVDTEVVQWLRSVKAAAYDASDALDGWFIITQMPLVKSNLLRSELEWWNETIKVSLEKISRRCFITSDSNVRMRYLMRELISKFLEIWAQRIKFPATPEEPPQAIYGRYHDKETIVNILLNHTQDVSILPIVGMNGIGKSTLAQVVYNDERVVECFEVRIWVHVSESFDVKSVFKAVIASAYEWEIDLEHLQTIQNKVEGILRGKRFLIVLDDVWNESRYAWDILKSSLTGGAKGSSIIVTTHLETVASITGYHLKPLFYNDCWSLFNSCAFSNGGEENPILLAIGKEIVGKCRGVPLVVKSLGSLLRLRYEEECWKLVRDSKIWDLKNSEFGIVLELDFSYNLLTSQLRRCFSYCSIFPKGYSIKKDQLIYLWMANGFVQSHGRLEPEDIGDKIFSQLLQRSVFHDFKKDFYGNVVACKMRGLMHNLASSLMEDGSLTMEVNMNAKVVNKIRHLSLICESLPLSTRLDPLFKSLPSLHTLLFFQKLHLKQPCMTDDLSLCLCLRALNLSAMSIETLLPSVCHLEHLRYLNLSNNRMTSLPESIHNLTSLQVLDLSGNEGITTLPISVGDLQSLRYFNLSECSLTSLPEYIFDLKNLRTLDFSKNYCITTLPSSIGNLQSLRNLNLSHCNLIRLLPESVCGLIKLQSLILRGCSSLGALPETIGNMSCLRHLDLQGCCKLAKMPVGIGKLSNLQTFNLFTVGKPDSESGYGGISELQRLNQLGGELEIQGLENVRSSREASQANLTSKYYVTVKIVLGIHSFFA